jgi:hypothetical protein
MLDDAGIFSIVATMFWIESFGLTNLNVDLMIDPFWKVSLLSTMIGDSTTWNNGE